MDRLRQDRPIWIVIRVPRGPGLSASTSGTCPRRNHPGHRADLFEDAALPFAGGGEGDGFVARRMRARFELSRDVPANPGGQAEFPEATWRRPGARPIFAE